MNHPRCPLRRARVLGDIGPSSTLGRRSQISKRETSGTADRGAGTSVPVKTHQRRGSLGPGTLPKTRCPTAKCCPPIPQSRRRPLCVSAPGSQKQRRLVTRVHVPLVCILLLFPTGLRFPPPLHLLHAPPAICAGPVYRGSSNPACPPKGRKGGACLRQREKYLERVDARRTAHSHLGRGDGV